jgi:hypothetical protein
MKAAQPEPKPENLSPAEKEIFALKQLILAETAGIIAEHTANFQVNVLTSAAYHKRGNIDVIADLIDVETAQRNLLADEDHTNRHRSAWLEVQVARFFDPNAFSTPPELKQVSDQLEDYFERILRNRAASLEGTFELQGTYPIVGVSTETAYKVTIRK